MSKDYLDKWEERAKKNTEIIEQTKTKMKNKINIFTYFVTQYRNLHYY